MSNGMLRILSSSLITLRPSYPRLDLPPTIASISCLSLLVKVRKLREPNQERGWQKHPSTQLP